MALSTGVKNLVDNINTVLTNIGYDYQIAYDASSTDAEMATEVSKIGAFPPEQLNKIIGQMNLIVQQRYFRNTYGAERNDWRSFVIDLTEGFGVEDIFQEIIDGHAPFWDDNDPQTIGGVSVTSYADLTAQEQEKIKKKFHVLPWEKQFKISTDQRNYKKVFTISSASRFMDVKLANLGASAEVYLLRNVLIQNAKDMVDSHEIVEYNGYSLDSKQNIKNFLEKAKAVADGMLLPSTAYNYDSVDTITADASRIFFLTTPEVMARISVQELSGAFNMSQEELKNRIIFAPNGTTFGTNSSGDDVNFIICDRDTFIAGIKMWEGSNFFVPNKFITNHWLTVEGIRGWNTFTNCVCFALGMDAILASEEDLVTVYVNSGESDGNNSAFLAAGMIVINGEDLYQDKYKTFNSSALGSFVDTYAMTVPKGSIIEYAFEYSAATDVTRMTYNGVKYGLNNGDSSGEAVAVVSGKIALGTAYDG